MNSANFSDDELLPNSESSSTLTRKSVRQSNSAPTNTILKAYQITAYKYINDKYENKGKLGLALLGSKQNRNFNILIYGKGNNPVAQVNINGDFNIYSSKEHYVTFYDHKSENWSLYFDMYDSFKDFVNRVCIYKFLASKKEFQSFDVKVGEGNACNENDLCELEIFICTIVNAEIVSTLYSTLENESKIIRLKLGSNKLIPIVDKFTVGMSKGGIRIIAVSCKSNFIKTSAINIPSDTDLLVQIKLVRSKSKVERSIANLPEISDSDATLPNLSFDRSHDQENVGIESKKSELISRMSKMGKPIMGLTTSVDNMYEPPMIHTSKPSSAHSVSYLANPEFNNVPLSQMGSTQMLPYNSNSQIFSNYTPNVSAIPNASNNVPVNNDFNILFTETRQNNTETRIALSKLQDKVDKIIENTDRNASSIMQRNYSSRHMDAEVVYDNIKRIIDENETFKKECSEKNSTINSLNNKINELLKSSQRYLDDSHNMIERKSVSFNSSVTEHQNKILELEEEKLKYIRSLSQKTSELSQLQMQLDASNGDVIKLKTQSVEYSEQLTRLTEEYNESKLKASNLIMEINRLKEIRKSESQKQSELEALKDEYQGTELKNQQKIEDLKRTITQINDKNSKIRAEYDSEITEIREQHNQELVEFKQKLKQERLKATSKSSDLDNEIESLNRNWEEKFEEFRKAESVKTTKLTEKNRLLMIENSGLNRELLELREKVTYSTENSFSELESMRLRNKQMIQELNEAQSKINGLSNIQYANEALESENADLKNQITKLQEFQLKNVRLTTELDETKSKLIEQTQQKVTGSDLETSLRLIMNGLFKKLKEDFEPEDSYDGRTVLNKCMVIIRDSTMSYMDPQNVSDEDEDDDEDSEEMSEDDDNESYTEDLSKIQTDMTSTMTSLKFEGTKSEFDYKMINSTHQTDYSNTADNSNTENDRVDDPKLQDSSVKISTENISYAIDEETEEEPSVIEEPSEKLKPAETIVSNDEDKEKEGDNASSVEKKEELKVADSNIDNEYRQDFISPENPPEILSVDPVERDVFENLTDNKGDEPEDKHSHVMINPEILKKTDELDEKSMVSQETKPIDIDELPSEETKINPEKTSPNMPEASSDPQPDPLSSHQNNNAMKKPTSTLSNLKIDSSDDDNNDFFYNLTKKSIESKEAKQIQVPKKDDENRGTNKTSIPKLDNEDDDLSWLN